jgi:thiamine pyrophosphate-dependent acetolactate synthase large subunit-like protein
VPDQPEKQPKNGAEVVVRTLESHGVEYVFGIPGAKIDAVFNALVDSKIRTVVCRHEQNAAFIAGGIGRMTGKAGVAIATSGPGVSNLVTGLATANSEGDPLVALGGAVATDEALKQIHQTMDSVSVCKPVTKFSAVVAAPRAVAEVVSNAFRASGEILSLKQLNLPVKIVVFNNSSFAFVEPEMKAAGIPDFATELHDPNFAGIAQAAGLCGVRVEYPEELSGGLKEAFSYDGPALLEVLTSRLELSMPPTIESSISPGRIYFR